MGSKPASKTENALFDGLPFDKVLNCVHCGLCLEACPTYKTVGVEQDSPRGRLYLMRGLWEGELELNPEVQAPLDRCLDCRACETACPSNVPYGSLLEQMRGVVAKQEKPRWWVQILRNLAFRKLLPNATALVLFARMTALYQKLGGARLVLGTPLGKLLPERLRNAHRLMPRFAWSSFKHSYQPAPKKEGAKRIGFFSGCVMDVADRAIHVSTLQVLHAAGYDVQLPKAQVCCGALQVHNGDRAAARKLALQNYDAFGEDLAQVIVNAAGCGAQLHEYDALFEEVTPEEGKSLDWQAFGRKFIDVMAFLAEDTDWINEVSWSTESVTVLYDAPCHLIHAQGVTDAPQKVMKELPGVWFVNIKNYQDCCGAAGIYNLLQPELSGAIQQRKITELKQTLAKIEQQGIPAPTYLITGNPGCIYQWRAGIEEAGLPLQVLHPTQFLAQRLEVKT
jgi:glycolate oxidase iron-sulfur subunit